MIPFHLVTNLTKDAVRRRENDLMVSFSLFGLPVCFVGCANLPWWMARERIGMRSSSYSVEDLKCVGALHWSFECSEEEDAWKPGDLLYKCRSSNALWSGKSS